ncbi:hypothetical protein B1218_38625, partial [Pseudomonas ogarae]
RRRVRVRARGVAVDVREDGAEAEQRVVGGERQGGRDAGGGGEELAVWELEAGGCQLLLQGCALGLGVGELATRRLLVCLVGGLEVQAGLGDALRHPGLDERNQVKGARTEDRQQQRDH